MRLKDKVALVTGGSRSMGKAIALGFAAEGADVAVGYEKNEAGAGEVVQQITGLGRRAVAVQADVSNPLQVEAMVRKVVDTFGRIDILMNNAGIAIRVPVLEMTEETWDRVVDVNLKGPFLVSQAVARQMVKRGGGAIINTTSVGAAVANYDLAHYQAAKAGLWMLTRSMALEMARYGIRVNAIEPGTIETDMNRARLADPQYHAMRIAKVPMARFGKPEDVVGAAIYLASDESSYATGMAIRVDGGQTIW